MSDIPDGGHDKWKIISSEWPNREQMAESVSGARGGECFLPGLLSPTQTSAPFWLSSTEFYSVTAVSFKYISVYYTITGEKTLVQQIVSLVASLPFPH